MAEKESFKAQAARFRRERAEMVERLAEAFSQSPAVIVQTPGYRHELWIWSGDMIHPGTGFRVSFFDERGPYSHQEAETEEEMLDELSQKIRSPKTALTPATDDDVIAWTTADSFVQGAKHTELTRIQNALGFYAGKADRLEWNREVTGAIYKAYEEHGIDGALDVAREALIAIRNEALLAKAQGV